MNRDEILKVIGDGTYCTVTFVKSNGDTRVMNCRLGVQKYLKGGEKKFDDAEKNLITVYDLKAKGYRSFKADKVISIRAHGGVYE